MSQEYKTLCFEEQCIRQGKQLFPESEADQHDGHRTLPMHPQSFRREFSDLMSTESMEQELENLSKQVEDINKTFEKRMRTMVEVWMIEVESRLLQQKQKCQELLRMFSKKNVCELTEAINKDGSEEKCEPLAIIGQHMRKGRKRATTLTEQLKTAITTKLGPFFDIINLIEKLLALPGPQNASVSSNEVISPMEQEAVDSQGQVNSFQSSQPLAYFGIASNGEKASSSSRIIDTSSRELETEEGQTGQACETQPEEPESEPQQWCYEQGGEVTFRQDNNDSMVGVNESGVSLDTPCFRPVSPSISGQKPTGDTEVKFEEEQAPKVKSMPKKKHLIKKNKKKGNKRRSKSQTKESLDEQKRSLMEELDMNIYFAKEAIAEDNSCFAEQVGQFDFDPTKCTIRSEDDLKLPDIEKVVQSIRQLTIGRKLENMFVPVPWAKIVRIFEEVPLTIIHLKANVLEDSTADEEGLVAKMISNCRETLEEFIFEDCRKVSEQVLNALLSCKQLKRLKLQGNYRIGHFQLPLPRLFQLTQLQFLSLSMAKLVDAQGDEIMAISSDWLHGIGKLDRLVYLSLYNCVPVYSDLLDHLHPKAKKNLFHLTLGMTQVNRNAIPTIATMHQLRQLSLQCTQFDGEDVLSLIKEMKDPSKLRLLSLRYLNGEQWQQDEQGFKNGIVSYAQLTAMQPFLTGLTYINVSAVISGVYRVNFTKFPALKNICMDAQHYERCKKQSQYAHIKCYCDTMVEHLEQSSQVQEQKSTMLSSSAEAQGVLKREKTLQVSIPANSQKGASKVGNKPRRRK